MNQNEIKNKNKKKQRIIIALIIAISVAVLVIVSAIIYDRFFAEGIREDAQNKALSESFDQKLKDNEIQSQIDRENSKKIIEKYSLDIFGKYVSVFNESSQTEGTDQEIAGNETQQVTTVMMINEDHTIDFADGKIGWWSLSESNEGIIHMGFGIEGAQSMGMFMLYNGYLIDVTGSGVLYGVLPEGDTIDCQLTDGNLTLTFNKDGTVDGEYKEMVTEEGVEFPYTEVLRGEYIRNGEYMDMNLNGSTARYLIFNAKTNDPERPISGIAARYFVKAD